MSRIRAYVRVQHADEDGGDTVAAPATLEVTRHAADGVTGLVEVLQHVREETNAFLTVEVEKRRAADALEPRADEQGDDGADTGESAAKRRRTDA